MNTIPIKCWHLIVACLWLTLSGPVAALADGSDDFNDNIKSDAKWGNDVKYGHGVLTERNQRLEYTCASPSLSVDDDAERLWKMTRFPYNADWEIRIDTFNTTAPFLDFQVCSFGIDLLTPHEGDSIYAEMYSSSLTGPPARYGFAAGLEAGDDSVGGADSGALNSNHGAVRMAFNSATKVITVYYDDNPADEIPWVQFGSFGVAGSGGADTNTDWHLTDSDQFTAYIYGYSAGMIIASGQMYGDNFAETGGVAPSGGPTPVPMPTGSFLFRFPTNNPSVAAIVDLTGNYTGSTPLFSDGDSSRNYVMDVAQDESGKLIVMGTIDGLANSDGSTEIHSSGTVSTVSAKPMVQLKTSFNGTGDGIPAQSKSTGMSPVETIDAGGGSNVVAVMLNVGAKVAGVPFRLKNMPMMFPANESFETGANRKNWHLALDINLKTFSNKERTVATAQLQLPGGDTIAFRERTIKYSKTKGYTLSFTGGTNVTAMPNRIDKKTSVKIKNLTFVQTGSDWVPTGGTITYKFLGQKGAGNLLDFVGP